LVEQVARRLDQVAADKTQRLFDAWATWEDCADAALNYGEALIEIVGQPWRHAAHVPKRACPWCGFHEGYDHAEHCPWIIAARALGIA
jgi:hypothetical protein